MEKRQSTIYDLTAESVGKKYGITSGLTLVMFVLALSINQLTDKNPLLVPHPTWCHHSSYYLKQKEKYINATLKELATQRELLAALDNTTQMNGIGTTTIATTEPAARTKRPKRLRTTTTTTTTTTTASTPTSSSSSTEALLSTETVQDREQIVSEYDEITPRAMMLVRKEEKAAVPLSDTSTKEENVLPSMYLPTMPRGLAETTAVFCFLWPLLPMVLNSRKTVTDAKIESVLAHVLGQTSNFGIAEIFRFQIPYPEDLFLEKCNMSPQECLRLSQEKIPLPLYVPPLQNNKMNNNMSNVGLCKGQFFQTNSSLVDGEELSIYNSLHHYPDAICMLFGASLVTFFTGICRWTFLNPTKKTLSDTSPTVRNILTISDIAFIACILCYLYYLIITYDLIQVVGLIVGVCLQLMINRTISYNFMKPQKRVDDVETTDAELKKPILVKPMPKEEGTEMTTFSFPPSQSPPTEQTRIPPMTPHSTQ